MKWLCLALCTWFPFSAVAYAQTSDLPRLSISGGYAVVHVNDPAGTFPTGWAAGVEFHAKPWLALVGDFNSTYKNYNIAPTFFSPGPLRGSNEAILGGLKFTQDVTHALAVFGEGLMGAQHSGTSGPLLDLYVTRLAVQYGAGIDVSASTRWAVRLQGDYRLAPSVPAPSEFFFTTGIVFRSITGR